MDSGILIALGGVGLFLLGMIVLTDGLRALAANRMRRMLMRTTKTPLRGVMAGAFATAVVQSSSATTVMAVGFVGAGLMTFPQGLGIIFGANIGTTMTGWIVAVFGFKVQLGMVASPLILLGVLLRMFAQGTARDIGWAISGFALLFLGIAAMQQGMTGLEGVITPESFPDDTLSGRILVVLIGVLITAVTQSSSAGFATALVALAVGSINFTQAAALVVGMNVGTTVTAFIATIGGSTGSRRTGYSHILYNVITAMVAFFLITPYTVLVSTRLDPQISLAVFHTVFNVLGVALFLPFIRPFEKLLVWLVPEKGPHLLKRLDEALLEDSGAAVDAVAATIRDVLTEYTEILAGLLDPERKARDTHQRLSHAAHALDKTRAFLMEIHTDPKHAQLHARHLDTVHAIDHLFRLSHRCQQETRVRYLQSDPSLRVLAADLRVVIGQMCEKRVSDSQEQALQHLQAYLVSENDAYRMRMVESATGKGHDDDGLLQKLDSLRWLQRVSFHLWRIVHHLHGAETQDLSKPAQKL